MGRSRSGQALNLILQARLTRAFCFGGRRESYNDVNCGPMDVRKRAQNERKFGSWNELPDGGRRYWREVPGRSGWKARYVKEVDADEETVTFYQVVHDENGKLREIHHKYPENLGHQRIEGEES